MERAQQLETELKEKLAVYHELLRDIMETMRSYREAGGETAWTEFEETGEDPGQRACREGME